VKTSKLPPRKSFRYRGHSETQSLFEAALGLALITAVVAHVYTPTIPVPMARPDRGGVSAVINAAIKYDVPIDLAVAVSFAESAFKCRAKSHAGAQGVSQVMPATARLYGLDHTRLNSCQYGAEAGMQVLRANLITCKWEIPCALSLYNSGRKNARNPETVAYKAKILALLK